MMDFLVLSFSLGGEAIVPSPVPISRSHCPTEIEPLAERLVQDLPSYANRANIKGKTRSQLADLNHVIIARQPEFEPIDLPNAKPDPNLKQIFITTLEHQTIGRDRVQFQQHHWFFLARTQKAGWRLVQSFSRSQPYPQGGAVTPPRESTHGAIAQGVRTWLRDCEAGRGSKK